MWSEHSKYSPKWYKGFDYFFGRYTNFVENVGPYVLGYFILFPVTFVVVIIAHIGRFICERRLRKADPAYAEYVKRIKQKKRHEK